MMLACPTSHRGVPEMKMDSGETNDERAETTHHWGCDWIDSLGATLLINCVARCWPRYFTWSQQLSNITPNGNFR